MGNIHKPQAGHLACHQHGSTRIEDGAPESGVLRAGEREHFSVEVGAVFRGSDSTYGEAMFQKNIRVDAHK